MRRIAIALLVLLLVALWVAAFVVPEVRGPVELGTAAVVLLVVLLFVVRWALARAKAAAIERAVSQKAPTDPERPDVAALRESMRRAVSDFKRRKKGAIGGGRNAVYSLPWYAVVGPPGAGKTAAIHRSGLSFAAGKLGSEKARDGSGTRGCDWWSSDEAILLDTAGRFAIDDDDRAEWFAFLDMLRRLRPKRPLDGLVLAVGAPDLLAASDSDRRALGAKLRTRIDDAFERLEMVLPVYLLLTKADLVAGFVEFFSDLGKRERAQVWGASFALSDRRLDSPGQAIEGEFAALEERLHERMIQRLPTERLPERRARIAQFPLELRELRAPVATLVEALSSPDDDAQRVPLLRGFYLTSAVQMGLPVDRVVSRMARAFAPNISIAGSSPAAEVHSYFLREVFHSVILPDHRLAVRSTANTARRSIREIGLGLGALGLSVVVLLPAVVNYVNDVEVAHGVSRAALALAARANEVPGTIRDPIEPLGSTLDGVDRQAERGWLRSAAAVRLRDPLRLAYFNRLDAALRARLQPDFERTFFDLGKVATLDDSPGIADEVTPLRDRYDRVKLYATLADPEGHADAGAATQLAKMWHRSLAGDGAGPIDEASLAHHAERYLASLHDLHGEWSNSPVVAARRRLKDLAIMDLPYHWLLRRAYGVEPLRASDLADGPSLAYLTCTPERPLVDGWYTAEGWRKIRPMLDAPGAWPEQGQLDEWVIAEKVPDRESLRKRYYEQYSGQWMAALEKCKVRSPKDFDTACAELRDLSGPSGFYKTVFTQFHNNAIAEEAAGLTRALAVAGGCGFQIPWMAAKDAGAGATSSDLSPVQRDFRPLLEFSGDEAKPGATDKAPLEAHRAALSALSATLRASGPPAGADLTTAIASIDASKLAIQKALAYVDGPTRGRLIDILMPPLDGTGRVLKGGGWVALSEEWRASVYDAMRDRVMARFPFNRAVAAQGSSVSFDDFLVFFQPPPEAGLLWKFVREHLNDFVIAGADGYRRKPNSDPLNDDVLVCLTVAKEITDAFFGVVDRGMRFVVNVDWAGDEVSAPKFVIGEKSTALARNEWSPTLRWFGEPVRLEWTQATNLVQMPGREDSFALFDLFRKMGGIHPDRAPGVYAAEVPPLKLKVRADHPEVLRPDFFSRLRCPEFVGARQ